MGHLFSHNLFMIIMKFLFLMFCLICNGIFLFLLVSELMNTYGHIITEYFAHKAHPSIAFVFEFCIWFTRVYFFERHSARKWHFSRFHSRPPGGTPPPPGPRPKKKPLVLNHRTGRPVPGARTVAPAGPSHRQCSADLGRPAKADHCRD